MLARPLATLALAASLGAAACHGAPEPQRSPESSDTLTRPALGLMTTLPLIWGEAEDIGEMLGPGAAAGWVRQALDRSYALKPLDTLDTNALAGLDRLVLAQPRVLSPAENVALDAWVRGGGSLLLFADPMLTRHSRFPIGDRRRPQDVILLSPLLNHWGLDLRFDEDQPAGERIVEVGGVALPVNVAGAFSLRPGNACILEAEGVMARCRIGKGRVLVVADAAVLDDPDDGLVAARHETLGKLLGLAFD